MLKRALDILAASILLSALFPVIAFAGVLIRIDSPGPAIFRQARMGRRFRRFQLYKLRTMTSEDGPAYTLGADPRITPIGHWLRRFKIDELPQLWNVLRGDMSIVGPRPVIPELAMEFDCAYRRLLSVRPGLTDPASLKYCQETEILARVANLYIYFKTIVTPDKIRISQDYLDRANLWTDAVVVIKTVLALATPPLSRGPRRRQPATHEDALTAFSFPDVGNGRTAASEHSPSRVMLHFQVPPSLARKPSLPPRVRGGDSMRIR